jgi:mevalonate kinase
MGKRVVATVPGKLILMGEHAVVYGRPAVVTSVGLTARVTMTPGDHGVAIDLPDIDFHSELSWSEILDYARSARSAWVEYSRRPDPETFNRVRGEDPDHLIKVALGEVAEGVAPERLPALVVEVESEIPIGAGFGSSAATAVGVVAAALEMLGLAADAPRIDRLAMEVERRQHGLPSGVDHRTVLSGGLTWAQAGLDGELEVEESSADPELLAGFHVFHTGAPEETTGAVVAEVRRRGSAAPGWFDEVLDRMGRLVVEFHDLLSRAEAESEEVTRVVRDYENCLEEIGVVPEEVRDVVRRIEAAGGAAKISGAGGLAGPGAGCLLVYWPHLGDDGLPVDLDTYTRYSVALGVDGLKVETSGE